MGTGLTKPRLRVVAAALFDREGRVLIAERPAGKHMAGWWEFPGGKVSAGESDAEALVRELREELGIEAQPGHRIMSLTHEYPDRIVDLVLWRATIARGEPRGLDGQRIKWVQLSALDDEKILPADQPLIAALQDTVPAEVLAFFDRAGQLNSKDCFINVLDRSASEKHTGHLRAVPVLSQLGLIVLDDANDSNPYCYVTRGIAAGMVVHFSHDPEPRIKFASLAAFEDFLVDLKARGTALWRADVATPPHPDQAALGRSLRELALSPMDDEVEFLSCLYLPLLRSDPSGVLESFSRSASFFVREAAAEALGTARIEETRHLLRQLAADKHPQVRSAADRAVKAWRS